VNRGDLQQLAELRLSEAQVLLDAGKFAGAYYLAGYAIECALKACIAKRTREFDFPEKQTVNRSHTHDLRQLLNVAYMEDELALAINKDVQFAENWKVVSGWSEASRYKIDVDENFARLMLEAVGSEPNGVLVWLRPFC
jgi:HEPN domain-containing protein